MRPGTKLLVSGIDGPATALPSPPGDTVKVYASGSVHTVRRELCSPLDERVNGKREHCSPGEGNVIRGAQ